MVKKNIKNINNLSDLSSFLKNFHVKSFEVLKNNEDNSFYYIKIKVKFRWYIFPIKFWYKKRLKDKIKMYTPFNFIITIL